MRCDVVGVEKPLMEAKAEIMEVDLGRVIREDHPTAMIDAILLTVDDKGMEMSVGPTHDELQNIMEIGNSAVAAD